MAEWNYIVVQDKQLPRPEVFSESLNLVHCCNVKEITEKAFEDLKIGKDKVKILYVGEKKTAEREN